MESPKMFVSEYSMYGLNRYRNFLAPPTCETCEKNDSDECDHECGPDDVLLVAEVQDELLNACSGILKEHGCSNSAIFVVYNNGRQMIVANNPDNEEVLVTVFKTPDIHAFAKYDAEERLCCYSLFIEQETGHWKIAQ